MDREKRESIIQSMRRLYAYLLDRLERLSKKKVSKKLKRLFSTLLVIDSSEIRGKKKRLHLLYEAKGKVLLDFEIGNNREVEHAENMLEDIEGSILLADRR